MKESACASWQAWTISASEAFSFPQRSFSLIVPAQVLRYRAGEQLVLLQNHCDLISQRMDIIGPDIGSAYADGTLRCIV